MINEALKQTKIVFMFTILFSILTGLIYPALITGIAQLLFPWKANGSLIEQGSKNIGSLFIGQEFTDHKYFWGRPSATNPFPYNAASSAGSNLGPSNPKFLLAVKNRVLVLKKANSENLSLIPIHLITASGSGLDPEISPAAALYQVQRIAQVRGLPENEIEILINNYNQNRVLGILGEPRVNVLLLNIALDNLAMTRNGHGRTSQ